MRVGLQLDQQASDRPDAAYSASNAVAAEPRSDAGAAAHRRARAYGVAFMLASGLLTVLLFAVLWYTARRLL